MLNTEDFILLAGNPGRWDEEVRQQDSGAAGQKVRTNLPELQGHQHDRGRRSVEVVKSACGWTVRCASGLDNFHLVAGSRRDAHWPGTYAVAAAWGINWANEDPENRECFVRKADAEEIVTTEVEMQAFGGGRIRTVVIPAAEGVGQTTKSPFWRDLPTDQKLDHIFYYGQNDFSLSRITAQSASATSSSWRASATALTRSGSPRCLHCRWRSGVRRPAPIAPHRQDTAICRLSDECLKLTIVGRRRRTGEN